MSESDTALSHMDQLRHALLSLHKALLDDERVSFSECMAALQPTASFSNLCFFSILLDT